MRARLKQLTAVTAVVLLAGVSLVACGGKDDSNADGVGESSGTTLTKANFFEELTQAQTKEGTSHVVMDMSIAGQKLKAEGDLKVGDTAADSAMAMTMDTGQSGMGSLEMRLVDQVFYLNFGPLTSNKFAMIDLTDENNPIGKQFSDIVGNLDPAQQFKQFEKAVTGFEQKGQPRTLDGVKAKPYVVTVDTSKIPNAADVPGGMPKTLQFTVFVGPDNLPRRQVSELPAIGGAGGGSVTIDFSKWGEEVSITKPKKSEITDKDFLSQFGGAPTPS